MSETLWEREKCHCPSCCKVGCHCWIIYYGRLNCMLCKIWKNCILFKLSSYKMVHIFKWYPRGIITEYNWTSSSNLNLSCPLLTVYVQEAVYLRVQEGPFPLRPLVGEVPTLLPHLDPAWCRTDYVMPEGSGHPWGWEREPEVSQIGAKASAT
jgi:hypothetical protein